MAANNELKLLRSALSRDRILFTVQRSASHSKDGIRVDCFASKGACSPGLAKVTGLVARLLKYRCSARGLIMSPKEDINRYLIGALSQKLEFDLKHERVY